MNALLEEQGKLQDQIDARGRLGARPHASRSPWTRCACPPATRDVAMLSGGERRRVALCRLLLQKPDLLLLDEPTNHLDAESVAWLERHLQEYPGTVVAITHDRYFLDNVAGWILELDRGRGIPWKGNYSSWLEQKEQRLALEEKQAGARQRTLERELEWIRMSPRARQAKGKARINAFEELRAEEEQRLPETVEIAIPPGPRLGDVVVEAESLARATATSLLFDELSFSLPPGGIVGVIGAQRRRQDHAVPHDRRARRSPTPATLRLGETVKLAYVDQSRDALDPEKTRLGGDQRRRRAAPGRPARDQLARLRGLLRLQGRRPAEAGRHALGRRAQPRAPGQAAPAAAATCCCSTSPPTTSTSTRCARSRRRCSASPAASW